MREAADKEISLAETAYRSIKEEILRNKFPSGEFISINDLSRALNGMGRTPVREAVQRLHDERLLTVVPRRGIIIPEFDIKKMMDQLEMRFVLERYAFGKAATNLTEERLEEIEDIVREMGKTEGKNSFQLAKMNVAFHMKIAEAANNKELTQSLSRIYDHQVRIYTYFLTDASRFEATQQEHVEIYEALKAGDKKRIEAAVDQHFENTRRLLLESILE
jgi:DNA-binding GntR family transcriptional regulator